MSTPAVSSSVSATVAKAKFCHCYHGNYRYNTLKVKLCLSLKAVHESGINIDSHAFANNERDV